VNVYDMYGKGELTIFIYLKITPSPALP